MPPVLPYIISGIVTGIDGSTAQENASLTLTNTRTGKSISTTSDATGTYAFDLANLDVTGTDAYSNRDVVFIEVRTSTTTNWNVNTSRYIEYANWSHRVYTSIGVATINFQLLELKVSFNDAGERVEATSLVRNIENFRGSVGTSATELIPRTNGFMFRSNTVTIQNFSAQTLTYVVLVSNKRHPGDPSINGSLEWTRLGLNPGDSNPTLAGGSNVVVSWVNRYRWFMVLATGGAAITRGVNIEYLGAT